MLAMDEKQQLPCFFLHSHIEVPLLFQYFLQLSDKDMDYH